MTDTNADDVPPAQPAPKPPGVLGNAIRFGQGVLLAVFSTFLLRGVAAAIDITFPGQIDRNQLWVVLMGIGFLIGSAAVVTRGWLGAGAISVGVLFILAILIEAILEFFATSA